MAKIIFDPKKAIAEENNSKSINFNPQNTTAGEYVGIPVNSLVEHFKLPNAVDTIKQGGTNPAEKIVDDYKKVHDSKTTILSVNYDENVANNIRNNSTKVQLPSFKELVSTPIEERIKNDLNTIQEIKSKKTEAKKKVDENKKKLILAQKDFDDTGDFTFLGKTLNLIGGLPSEPLGKETTRKWLNEAKEDYYSSIGEYVSYSGDIEPKTKTKEKLVYNAGNVQDVISWLVNGKKGTFSDTGKGLLNTPKSKAYNYIKETEKKTLVYLYNEDGKKSAEEYLEYLTPILNERMTVETIESAKEFAGKHPAAASAVSHITNLGKGKGITDAVSDYYSGNGVDVNSPGNQMGIITNTIRNEVSQYIRDNTKDSSIVKGINKVTKYVGIEDIPTFLYKTVTSAVDSAVNFAFSKGIASATGVKGQALNGKVSQITSLIMGSQVAQDSIIEAKEKGASDSESITLGVIRGLIESITEKYSIDTILDNPGSIISKIIKSPYKKAFVAEGSEEVGSNWLNRIADALYYGNDMDIKKNYQKYFKETGNKGESLTKVVYDVFKEDASSFLAGGISGLGINITNNIIDSAKGANVNKIGKAIAGNEAESEVINIALSLGENTEAAKLARQITESGDLSVGEIGRVALYSIETLNSQKSQTVKNSIYDRVKELGGSNVDATSVSEFYSKFFTNTKMSNAEANMADNNKFTESIWEQSDWFEDVRKSISEISQLQNRLYNAVSTNASVTSRKNEIERIFETGTSFAKQIDDVLNGTHNPRYDIYISETPKVFTDIGFSNSALLMRNSKVNEILEKHPEMSVDTIKQIPQAIQNPILILKSKTHPTESVVAITDIQTDKGNMVVPVWVNQTGNYIDIDLGSDVVVDTNFVASAYGRNVKTLIEYANENDGFLYQNDDIEKVRQLLARNGLQLPTPLKLSDSDIIIPQNDTGVNNIISESGEDYAGNTSSHPSVKKIMLSNNNKERHHTTKAEQDFIKEICNALGREVVFEHIKPIATGIIPDGYIDENNIIHIGFTVTDPVKFVFKHELTHFGEGTAEYKRFVEIVKNSKAFREWLATKTKLDPETNSLEVMIAQARENVMNSRSGEGSVGVSGAMAEVIADFVGDCLFKDNGSGLTAMLSDLDVKQRNVVIQYILDFLSYLKKKLAGDKNIVFEISRLEDSFNRMLSEATYNGKTEQIGKRFSFARVKDSSIITQAENMESEGAERDEIWQKLRIIRDSAGEWIYEISDKDIKFFPEGDALKELPTDLKEYYELANLGRMTAAKRNRFEELRKKYGGAFFRKGKLEDFLKHDELFEKFPRLRKTNLEFKLISTPAHYDPYTDTIVINATSLKREKGLKGIEKRLDDIAYEIGFEEDVVHEIEHALQEYEDRERGSSPEFWNRRLLRGERLPINPETNKEYTPFEAYMATKGEYEARESESRKYMDEEERRENVPDLGWGKTISVNEPALAKNQGVSQLIDNKYISAVENADTETAQRLTDEAAKANGYTERLYHQTGAEFTEFNTKNQKAGKYDNELPTGTFLKPSDADIGLKGKKQMELYAKIENPLTFEDRQDAREFWKENIPGYAEADKKLQKIDSEYRFRTDEAMDNVRTYLKEWRKNNPDADSREIYQDKRYQELNDYEDSIVDEWEEKSNTASLETKKLIDDFISESGYDGVIIEKDQGSGGRYTKSYIVFSSNQLKDASPVTYDDNGNIIALSERFNKSKSDIRYSIPRKNVNTEPIDLSNDSELSKRIGDIHGSGKYKIIQNYILETLDEQPVTLSDGKLAYVDRSDSQHIARNAGNKKTAQISQIKKIVDNAKLVAEENSEKERKFNYFYYYETFVKHGNDTYPIYLNVGRTKNDGTYHIYDITQKLRDTAHRVNDVERPKPNEGYALKNDISNNSISKLNDDVNKKFSIPTETESLLDKYDRGEISREEYEQQLDELWQSAHEKYGSIEQGENAVTPIAVPKQVSDDKFTERFVRTFMETGKLTSEMIEDVEREILLGDTYSYKVVSDEAAQKSADRHFERGIAEDTWNEAVSQRMATKNDIAIGEKLLLDAIERNDRLRVIELSSELADVLTRAGQTVQAAQMLKKMSGIGRLVTVQRKVKTINKSLVDKYGDKAPKVQIDPTLARQLANAKTQKELDMVEGEIWSDVANQEPVTWLDKWNAWRNFAMLFNPRTHIRNVVGNAIFTPAVRIKDFIASGMEAAFVKDRSKRTKSLILKKEYVQFAKEDGKRDDVKQLLKGNKYNDKSALKEKQQIFKNKAMEFLTRFSSNTLEAEDMLFKNKHYIHALAGFLQARNINLDSITKEELWDARNYAATEARKATFNDESVLAEIIGKIRVPKKFEDVPGAKTVVKSVNFFVDGILPFKRTPINIVKRGIEYSPIGLAKTLVKGVYDVKKGKFTPTEFIDGLASGLTGTGIMLAGMFLANLGLISGGGEDDEESTFDKWFGKQEYAIEFAGHSYTIDWAAPACIPFFIGVEIVNTVSAGEDLCFADISDVVWNSLEPITNLSMLSGIQGVIESTRYADSNQIIASIVGDVVTSYAMQGMPSILGSVGRTIDPTQRSWYTDKNSKVLDSFSQSIINNVKSKVPGLSYTQIPKIDVWGREVSRGKVGERVIENFISPGYYSKIEYSENEEELKRLWKSTGENVFPKVAAKYFEVDGVTKHLTADEYVTFAKAKGQYSFDYIQELLSGSAYNGLDDDQKAEVITNLYSFANAKAKSEVSDYDPANINRYKAVTEWEQNGNSAVNYYIANAISK